MTVRWVDATSSVEAEARTEVFWSAMRTDIDAGTFWADRLKTIRGDATRRLEVAMDHLPLPGAFANAAIALRSQIRARRAAKESCQDELAFLYRLAAMRSFMIDYSSLLGEPGFNVMESAPGHVISNLRFEYKHLGHQNLTLLNTTDRKWLVELWGLPERHSTLNELHHAVWKEYESRLLQARKSQRVGE